MLFSIENLEFIKKRNERNNEKFHKTDKCDTFSWEKLINIAETGQNKKFSNKVETKTKSFNDDKDFVKSRHLSKYLSEKNSSPANHTQKETQVLGQNYLSWNISTPIASRLKAKQLDQIPSMQTNMFEAYLKKSLQKKYKTVDLKDVPMNELVKKLQKEFELENDAKDLDLTWNRLKQLNRNQRNEQDDESNLLKSLIENSVKVLIDKC